MSKAPHEATSVLDAGFGDRQYPPQSAPNQASQGMSDFVDGSGLIFSMYLKMAEEEDKKMAENWKADADGILVFTGLFSAAVASLISVSIQDIRPNPQDISNFYLANIYQTVADPSRPNISSSLPSSPPPFSPPNYAIWVNALWFMSLVISISCALLATLLQQWARRYLRVTQPRYGLHKRARIRTFFFEGVPISEGLPFEVGRLPTLLLHVSLFLFFAGLVVFLWNVYLTIFTSVLSWVSICMVLYGCVTFMPAIRPNSPFHTPLSPLAPPTRAMLHFLFRFLSFPFCEGGHSSFRYIRKMLSQGIQKIAEETALNSPEIDVRAFMRTFDSLDEDHELEHFFFGLPGFRSSKVVDDPLPGLYSSHKERLSTAIMGLFDRTFSSDSLPDPFKNRRAIICAKALDPEQFPHTYWDILRRVTSAEDQHRGLQTAEFLRVMRSWGNGGKRETDLLVQAIFTSLDARARRHDDSWLISAAKELGIPESDLRDYAAHGDSLSLAILIHLTRQQFSLFENPSWPAYMFSRVLQAASAFDVQDTSPDLQHEFCALWNQIVFKAQNDDDRWMAIYILGPIRNVYVALHRNTDSSPTRFSAFTSDDDDILNELSSYPVCNVAGHIHDDDAITSVRTVLYDHAVLTPASLASPDAPSLPGPAPLHVDENLTTMPSLDDDIYVSESSHPAHQTTTESLRIFVTSPDPATTGAIPAIITSGITTHHSTPETSTSAPSLSSTPPPSVVALRHSADLLAPSDSPNHSSSASHPFLDNTPPTGFLLSSCSPMTRSDPSPSFTGCHLSAITATAPSASTGPVFAPGLRTAVKDDGNPKPGPCKEKDPLDPPSAIHAIHANTMVTLDPPPPSSSLASITDVDPAIVGPSLRETNAKCTGDLPPHPLHCPYDIV